MMSISSSYWKRGTTLPVLLLAACFMARVSSQMDRAVLSKESVVSNLLRGSTSTPLSEQFPTLAEAVEMSKLSSLVYSFKGQADDYCSSFSNEEGIQCHWYFHDAILGTQVMIASNPNKKYVAVVFAGTDDLRTSLQDMDVAKKAFGDNSTVQLHHHPDVKVHQGFDNAVFSEGVYSQVEKRIRWLRIRHPFYKLYTTGHSLGAADSILTATALAQHGGYSVVSINFGCPKTGNREWRNYLNETSALNSKLGIWRIVLGWDLVARLPEFFDHVGHTIQLWSEDHYKYNEDEPDLVECYYGHYGEKERGYAGVPSGWNAMPYFWMPGAINHHFVLRYVEYLELLSQKGMWVDSFKEIDTIDDDDYDEPPDDWYILDEPDYDSLLTDTNNDVGGDQLWQEEII